MPRPRLGQGLSIGQLAITLHRFHLGPPLPNDAGQPNPSPVSMFMASLDGTSRSHAEQLELARHAADEVWERIRRQGGAPPRRVAVAMCLGVLSTPHLGTVLADGVRDGSIDVAEGPGYEHGLPVLLRLPVVSEALRIPFWELEELQDEIDRRAGHVLKRQRIASWLWAEFGLPDPAGARSLARTLFPHIPDDGMDLVRRGAHLYAVADHDTFVPEAAMWLPWLAPRPSHAPTGFRARQVDPSLRHRLARGVGADPEELIDLLDGMVAVVPRDDAAAFVALDAWRHTGRAALADLGAVHARPDSLVRPLPDEGASWRTWLERNDRGELALRTPAAQIFDMLALPRVSEMVQALYGLMMALVYRDAGACQPLQRAHLDLFDVARHLRAVLNPLIEWAGRSTAHQSIARELEIDADRVSARMLEVQRVWREQALRSWLEGPTARNPSVQLVLVRHLLATHRSLRELMATVRDPYEDHADVMLHFAAHYLREGRLERLWIAQLSDVAMGEARLAPVEDIPGYWFVPTFDHLLRAREADLR